MAQYDTEEGRSAARILCAHPACVDHFFVSIMQNLQLLLSSDCCACNPKLLSVTTCARAGPSSARSDSASLPFPKTSSRTSLDSPCFTRHSGGASPNYARLSGGVQAPSARAGRRSVRSCSGRHTPPLCSVVSMPAHSAAQLALGAGGGGDHGGASVRGFDAGMEVRGCRTSLSTQLPKVCVGSRQGLPGGHWLLGVGCKRGV